MTVTSRCEKCGQEQELSDDEFRARRNDLFREAQALLAGLGFQPEVAEVLDVASFLEGSE